MKQWKTNTGIPWAYRERGSGPILVLLHAFPMASEMWEPQLAGLSRDYRVLCPDLFGFGETPAIEWTIDSAADTIRDWLDGIGIREPVIVGGLSMGGYVALSFARRHADRLRGLILADTRAEPDSTEAKTLRDSAIAAVQEKGSGFQIQSMISKIVGTTTNNTRPEIVSSVLRMGESQSVAGICAGLQALRDRPDAAPSLSQIRVPTLVIVGEEDVITPPDVAVKLAAGISQSRCVKIPQAGHLSNWENPEAFNREVRTFLESVK